MVIDKPVGVTSSDVVVRVRRATGAARVGHAGTLDPLATGILPLAFGEATKTVAWAMAAAKVYRFTLRWGEARETDDAAGAVTATSEARPTEAAIRAVLPAFTGDIMQVPPVYSALKVAGRRACDLARDGRPPDLAARPARVDRLHLAGFVDPDHAVFEVTSGKGVYMRALARDIALALGTVGHVAALRRLSCGGFGEDRAISLDKAESLGHIAPASEHLLPVETALDDIPALALTGREAVCIRHGQPVPVLRTGDLQTVAALGEGATVCAMSEGRLVALARVAGQRIQPVRVINNTDGEDTDVDYR